MNDSDYERLKKELHEFMADLQSDVHYLGKAFEDAYQIIDRQLLYLWFLGAIAAGLSVGAFTLAVLQ
jgi:hypothetical protein